MLWGAPGVGKSQVVSSVLDALRDSDGEGPTVVSVNVLGMRKMIGRFQLYVEFLLLVLIIKKQEIKLQRHLRD